LLVSAVPSTYSDKLYPSRSEWEDAVGASAVRLQWDPDHHPSGAKLERRAIQLGLRDETLRAFGRSELLEVIDLTEFVAGQRPQVAAAERGVLLTPVERMYRPADPALCARLGLAAVE
jgi:hypothetical protein